MTDRAPEYTVDNGGNTTPTHESDLEKGLESEKGGQGRGLYIAVFRTVTDAGLEL